MVTCNPCPPGNLEWEGQEDRPQLEKEPPPSHQVTAGRLVESTVGGRGFGQSIWPGAGMLLEGTVSWQAYLLCLAHPGPEACPKLHLGGTCQLD